MADLQNEANPFIMISQTQIWTKPVQNIFNHRLGLIDNFVCSIKASLLRGGRVGGGGPELSKRCSQHAVWTADIVEQRALGGGGFSRQGMATYRSQFICLLSAVVLGGGSGRTCSARHCSQGCGKRYSRTGALRSRGGRRGGRGVKATALI